MERQPDPLLGRQNLPNSGPGDDSLCDVMDLEVRARARAELNTMASDPAQSSARQSMVDGRILSSNQQSHPEVSTSSTPVLHSLSAIDIRKANSAQCGPWQTSRALASNNNGARTLQDLREADIATLYGQIADLEKKNETLSAMLEISKNAREMCESAGKDPKESQFRLYQEQLWDLQQRNIRLENTAEFFKLNPFQSRRLRIEDIDRSIDHIRSVLESILGDCDITDLQLNTNIEPESDLEALLLSCLDLYETPEDLKLRLDECIWQVGTPVILRTLAMAALKDWVFNTHFPQFMAEGATSMLLKSMQEIAFDHSNWAWLRNWETAAYSRFLKRSEFTEGIVPWKSGLLAERLSNVAASFLKEASLENGTSDGCEALNSVLRSLHCRFIQLFSAGLTLKAETGATDNRYEFIVHAPGVLTVENGLELVSGRSSKIKSSIQGRQLTRSWFHASFKVYGASPPDWLDPRADAIIHTDNFVPGMSKTTCHCIHTSDITIERTENSLGNPNLQTHGLFGTTASSQRDPFPPVAPKNQLPDSSFSDFGGIDGILQQRSIGATQAVSASSKYNRRRQIRPESFSKMEISQTKTRVNKYNCVLLDKVPLETPFEAEGSLIRVVGEITRSETPVFDEVADSTHKSNGTRICLGCSNQFLSNKALKRHERHDLCRRCIIHKRPLTKHQTNDHPIKKRRKLSPDEFPTKLINLEKPGVDKNSSCEKCGYEPTNSSNLRRHKIKKSCSKCFKCHQEFDSLNELHSHMEITHGLQLTDRWRRIDVGERGANKHSSSAMSRDGTPERSGTESEQCHFDNEREEMETRIFPPPKSKHAQANGRCETAMDLKQTQNVESNRSSFTQMPLTRDYCSICEESFTSAYNLQRHQQRQCHFNRVSELKKRPAPRQQSSVPKHHHNHRTKGTGEDGIPKSRVQKPRRSRASTEMRREPTPESRHVARIIAKVDEAEKNINQSFGNSKSVDQQPATSTPSVLQNNNSIKSARPDSASDTTTTNQSSL